jgi:hypothetical protein|tara:strand:+ start:2033 stop:3052 length:1020 start_codon:yes stop_codon:yes gene_type:complete
MSIKDTVLASSPELNKIIEKAVKRIGENHALARDSKGVEMKANEIEEDRKEWRESKVIEESLKAVANEMAEKMVLENAIDGMIKETLQGEISINNKISGGSGFEKNQGTSDTLTKFNKRQEMGEQEEKELELDDTIKETVKKLVSKKLKKKNISEAEKTPGIDAYQKAHKKSKSFNDSAMKDTKKKFKEYDTFEGSESPEFPHQENSKTNSDGQFQYYRNNEESDEFIEDFGHPGLLDFDINNVDMERLADYLEGSSETGNAQTDKDGEALGNVVPSDLGEKMLKSSERRKEKIADQKKSMTNLRGYTPDVQKVKQVKEGVDSDIKDMKKLWAYNKKTQ